MKIETVIYRNREGIEEDVNINDIGKRTDYEVVKRNLYCSYEGCLARIEYVPKGKKIAHFRTWPRDDHSQECENFFEREMKKALIKNSAVNSAKLTDSHIRGIVKDMKKVVNETPEEKELRLEKQRANYKRKKNSTIDISQNPVTSNVARPSTNNDAEYQATGTRAPSVRRRFDPSDVTEGDINNAVGLTGNVVAIQLFERRAIIVLKKRDSLFNVYLEEDFYSDSTLNLDTTLEALKRIKNEGTDFSFFGVGNIERRENGLCMLLSSQNHIYINGYKLEVFIYRHNNPRLFEF